MVLRKGSDYFPLHFHAHMRLNNPGGIKQVVMRSKGIGAYCPVYYYLDRTGQRNRLRSLAGMEISCSANLYQQKRPRQSCGQSLCPLAY